MRVGCIGMSTIDTALFVADSSHEPESVQIVDEFSVSLGGKGLITAIAMSHEGVDVAPLALVGRTSRITEHLSGQLCTDWLVPAQAQDSQIWLTIGERHRVAAFVAVGECLITNSDLEELGSKYAASVDALYLSFDVLPLLRGALTRATRQQIPVAVNLSRPLLDRLVADDRGLLNQLVTGASLILCNDDESKRILQAFNTKTWADVAGTGTSLVITEGDAGGLVRASSDVEWRRYEPVRTSTIKSVVGAGDTFNGALLAAHWGRSLSLIDSCKPAAVLASACLGVPSSSILGVLDDPSQSPTA
jgi:sugar/nucleoside kinase (ribokinase family)